MPCSPTSSAPPSPRPRPPPANSASPIRASGNGHPLEAAGRKRESAKIGENAKNKLDGKGRILALSKPLPFRPFANLRPFALPFRSDWPTFPRRTPRLFDCESFSRIRNNAGPLVVKGQTAAGSQWLAISRRRLHVSGEQITGHRSEA